MRSLHQRQVKDPIYALDDQSAIKIVDNSIEVVSEGKWIKLNSNL
jgi:dipeptidase E